ncbi:MAG: 50S ribosomal protein L25 [Candidatus Acidoferrales bacterium]
MTRLQVEAQPRPERGTNRARQLRRAGRVPAVVYGGKDGPVTLSVNPRHVAKILASEAGQNAVFTLQTKGQDKTPAMIRDWQVDPVKGLLLHVDFLRVSMEERLKVKVPVHVQGEPVGVKQQGGILELVQREVELECLPGDIPDEFVVQVSELNMNQSLRVGDLKVEPKKLRILTDAEQVLAHVVPPRKVEEEVPVEAAVEGAEAAEPEVVGKGKEKEEAEAGEAKEEAPEAGAEGGKKEK